MFSLYFSTRPTEPGASRYHPAVLKSHHQANLATYAGFACQLTLYYNDVRYSFFFFSPRLSSLFTPALRVSVSVYRIVCGLGTGHDNGFSLFISYFLYI